MLVAMKPMEYAVKDHGAEMFFGSFVIVLGGVLNMESKAERVV